MITPFCQILTDIKHCILWLGFIVHRVKASDILEEAMQVGVGAGEKMNIWKVI